MDELAEPERVNAVNFGTTLGYVYAIMGWNLLRIAPLWLDLSGWVAIAIVWVLFRFNAEHLRRRGARMRGNKRNAAPERSFLRQVELRVPGGQQNANRPWARTGAVGDRVPNARSHSRGVMNSVSRASVAAGATE